MGDVISRDVVYWHETTRMLGRLCLPAAARTGAAVLLLPDAHGVTAHAVGTARRLAGLGRPVLVADLWGERLLPTDEAEFGPLIGAMAGDRARWLGRVRAAHRALAAAPEAGTADVVALGYCFGGSSALEYTRSGAEVAGVISVHGGLDLVGSDWSAAGSAPVLVCTGADDPMATADMRARLASGLSGAGVDWQTHVYGGTVHAFTRPSAKSSPRPGVVAYSARGTARAWDAALRFLHEIDAPRQDT
ncbi:dienelactone hydrolase family protein [Streptomyces sp. NPDC050560]|uniref:dienelactone hydrolase family protein n=1 Tax=Streptomyces sp. NPDC050560 TaxID=3365630 RepID=UPI00379FE4FD